MVIPGNSLYNLFQLEFPLDFKLDSYVYKKPLGFSASRVARQRPVIGNKCGNGFLVCTYLLCYVLGVIGIGKEHEERRRKNFKLQESLTMIPQLLCCLKLRYCHARYQDYKNPTKSWIIIYFWNFCIPNPLFSHHCWEYFGFIHTFYPFLCFLPSVPVLLFWIRSDRRATISRKPNKHTSDSGKTRKLPSPLSLGNISIESFSGADILTSRPPRSVLCRLRRLISLPLATDVCAYLMNLIPILWMQIIQIPNFTLPTQ